jgi:hypothetical protein
MNIPISKLLENDCIFMVLSARDEPGAGIFMAGEMTRMI